MRAGTLMKNDCGRWEVDGCELASGSVVEILPAEEKTWINGRIEHDGKDYYLLASRGAELRDGMLARVP